MSESKATAGRRPKQAASKTKDKIRDISDLATHLSMIRKRSKVKVAHCHGVFDLLHVGHIRHLNEAKSMADILVVTITPDRFVNKGPNRPAFPDELRAEMLAALDCVDYVAINRWPMAAEAIGLIRPDFYVKGPDYKNSKKDHTGGIQIEERAVAESGGKLVITDDIQFSSSALLNRHFPVWPKEVSSFLNEFSKRYTPDKVIEYLEKAKNLKVLVVGDAIIDEYQYCEAMGKSSKEPMLAIKRLSTESFAGGCLAIANHVSNFCDSVSLITLLGSIHSHEKFIRASLSKNVKPNFLYRADSPTTVKRRFVESYFFTKMLELYEINDGVLEPGDNDALCRTLKAEVPKYDVVILADFGHGLFTREAIEILCDKSKFLALNAQSNAGNVGYQSYQKYRRADFISMAEQEIKMEVRDRRGDIKKMMMELFGKIECRCMTVTRGKNGSIFYTPKDGFVETPAFAGKVVDRMGAGDSYFALTSLAVACGIPTEVIGFVGNVVGAQAVATVGHRCFIERAPLFKNIESLLKR